MIAFLSNSWLALLLAVVAGYLLGSVNWAIIVTRAFSRKDIREEGSGNAGATNVLRAHGKLPALLTTVGDILKSVLAALLGGWLLTHLHLTLPDAAMLPDWAGNNLWLIGGYFGGFAGILGHVLPVFYGFRGGKGVLTTLGMFLVLDWRVALTCLGIFIVIVAITRMVSLGSVLAIGCGAPLLLVLGLWVDHRALPMIMFTVIFAVLVETVIVLKHKENIKRIIAGTERKLGEKS